MRFTDPANPDGGLWLWRPVPQPRSCMLDELVELRMGGWEPVETAGDIAQASLALVIWGQLGTLQPVIAEGSRKVQRWAHQSDVEHAREYPVALSFNVPEQVRTALGADVGRINMVPMLPPPQWGEWGMILEPRTDLEDDGEHYPFAVTRHHITALGEEGTALYQRIQDTLRALAAPAEWWIVTPELKKCIQGEYQISRMMLESDLLAARSKKERERIKWNLSMLETAEHHAEALREATRRRIQDPTIQTGLLTELRALARHLAQLYHAEHKRWLSTNQRAAIVAPLATPQPEPEPMPEPPPAPAAIAEPVAAPERIEPPADKPARRRGPRATPRAALVVRDPPGVMVRSDIFTQGIARALLSGDDYTQYEDRQMAEYTGTLAKDRGDITITIKPDDGENWEHVLRWLNMLGDEIVDSFVAAIALAIDTNGSGAEHITAPFWLSPDDILEVCQREKSNRAYTPGQRAVIIEHLRVLSRAHIIARWPTGRRGRESQVNSAIIDVLGQAIGEYKTITGEPVWERRQVKVGEWARMLGGPFDRQTALMLRTVLKYHAQRDRYAKRLGRYLTLQFRVNAKHGGTVERTMGTLMDQARIKLDAKHPDKTRQRIEDALRKLQADGVIGEYGQVVEADTPAIRERHARIEQRAYGWWADYEQILWHIEPPELIRAQYAGLLREPDDADDSEQ